MNMLDKSGILQLLQKRFADGYKRLQEIPDPALLHGAQKAATRIARAIRNKEKIVVVGDYDVDGVVATALVVEFFSHLGYVLEAHIPNRFSDGYGVSPVILERIEADVIITVDNGITAHEAAQLCKERGIDLIITDHHTPAPTLPDAYAIVNPKQSACRYPFKEICGAQVAWLLMALLKRELQADVDMRSFCDLLAIAIIADVMPLIDINRTLVKEGLKVLQTSSRSASVIIRDFLNKSAITSEDIAFMIAPRLNSAGRLEDASLALAFLTAPNRQEAYETFERLCALNELRKEIELQTMQEASAMVDGGEDVIVVAKEGWHEGVVGIVASRLVERFGRPAVVLSIGKDLAKGSARSLGRVDIYALIAKSAHALEGFGGHTMAAGVTLKAENIPLFRSLLNQNAAELSRDAFVPKEELVGVLRADAIDAELLDILERFEPYGEANERPKFLAKDAEVLEVRSFGAQKNHCRLRIRLHPDDAITHEFVLFKRLIRPQQTPKLTFSYSVTKNEFNGRVSLQLLIGKIYEEENSPRKHCQ